MEDTKSGYLSENDYKKAYFLVPIPCVDILVTSGSNFLLEKRINEPAKGEWFFPGGRIYKGELVGEALERKIKEELGISAVSKDFELITIEDHIFESGMLGGEIHNISLLYRIDFSERPEIVIDETQADEVAWFNEADDSWHPYVKKALLSLGYN